MVEDRKAGASRYGPLFTTAEEIHVAQGRIRAASARQRRLAASMRAEALELRAQNRRVAGPRIFDEDERRSRTARPPAR